MSDDVVGTASGAQSGRFIAPPLVAAQPKHQPGPDLGLAPARDHGDIET